jgi:hypothetical protein
MFFQSLTQNFFNYIGARPPPDGQLVRYDATVQGWVNTEGLTASSVGGITTEGDLNVISQDPPIPGSPRVITVDGKGNGSFLRLINSDSGGLTDTFLNADDTGVFLVSPKLNLVSSDDVLIAAGAVNVFRLRGTTGFLTLGIGTIGSPPPEATAQLDIVNNTIRLRNSRTPSSATASGNRGDICWDTNYIYVCVATNTWKRTAISGW